MNSNKLNLYMNILKIVLVAAGVIFCLFLFGGPNPESEMADQIDFRDGAELGLAVNYTGFIILAGIGLILVFFLVQLITNPKRTVMSIIGIVAALVVYLIFTMMGTSDTNESLQLAEDVQVSQGTIVSTTAGLYTVLVAIVIAALGAIFLPLVSRLRN